MHRFATADVGGSPMTVLVTHPDKGEGPFPGLVLMPHRNGIDIFTFDRAIRLAAEGIVSVAPDVYHRQAGTVPTSEGKDRLRDEEIEADIGAALGLLTSDARVDQARIGILGHCQGGRTALIGMVSFPEAFCMGCIYYGGSVFKRMGAPGPTPAERMAVIEFPVAGFFGNEDQNPSPADVDRLDAEMTAHGIAHEFHRFDGAGHAFQDFSDPRRGREPQGAQAWELTLDFLRRQLRPGS